MGRKVHPLGFRIGVIRDWQARWYADKNYPELLQEDFKLRQAIQSRYAEAGISLVEIERQANEVDITIHTARPGIVIGRGGQRVDETRLHLEKLIGKKTRLNIREIQQPELDAYLVARAVAEQMEHRIAHRRAMKQAIFRTMQAGAQGIRIRCAGRLGGAEIARRETLHQGRVPLQTLRADIDYGFTEARTTLGRIGVKVWIYKGDILPEPTEIEIEEAPAVPVSESAEETVAAPASESTEETVAAPASESTEETVAEPVSESAEETIAEPVSESAEETIAEPVSESTEETVAEPVSESAEETIAEPVSESVETTPATSTEEEEKDVTTQASETPQDSSGTPTG